MFGLVSNQIIRPENNSTQFEQHRSELPLDFSNISDIRLNAALSQPSQSDSNQINQLKPQVNQMLTEKAELVLDDHQPSEEKKWESVENEYAQKQVQDIQKNAQEKLKTKKGQQFRLQRFIGGEIPKTYTNAFGSLDDYLSFFENRTPEMANFVKMFQKAEADQDLEILNQNIAPAIIDCIHKEAIKINQKKKGRKILVKLFQRVFADLEEFYEIVLKAYTMETFLYKQLNEHLRNEDWTSLDDLLPYAFCLCKTFQCPSLTSTCNNSLQKQSTDNQEEITDNLILYRGARFDEESLNCYKPDRVSTFSWNAMTSTSRNPDIATMFSINNQDPNKIPVIFIIEVAVSSTGLKNLNLIDTNNQSEFKGEEEILLAPGSIFELVSFNRDENGAQIRLRLISDSSTLPLQGKIMPGAMHVQVSKGKVAKIIGQQEKELIEALLPLRGNKMIEKLEFSLCKYDEITLKALAEILPTLPKLTHVVLFYISFDHKTSLETLVQIIGSLRIRNVELIDQLLFEQSQIGLFIRKVNDMNLFSNFKLELSQSINRGNVNLEVLDNEKICLSSLTTVPLRSLTINFESSAKITNELMESLCSEGLRYLTALTSLTLNLVSSHITDEEIKNLCSKGLRYLTSLASLTLYFASASLTYEGVKNLCVEGLRCFTSLTALTLDFRWCYRITDEGVTSLCSEGLRYLTSLTALTLNFRRCIKITDDGIKSLCLEGLRYLVSLKTLTLDFQNCKTITDEGLTSLGSEAFRYLTSLTILALDFTQCYEITDEGVKSLSSRGLRYLTSLTTLTLNFGCCNKITDEGIKSLCSEGLRSLVSLTALTLNFPRCSEITYEGVKCLCSEGLIYLTSLTILAVDFEHCEKIMEEGLDYLTLQAEILKLSLILHVSPKSMATSSSRVDWELKRNSEKHKNENKFTFNSSEDTKIDSQRFEKKILDETLNQFCSEGLKHLTSLTTLALDFSRCKITDEGVKSLSSEGLRSLTSLTALSLDFRCALKITDKGIKSLCSEGLRYLTSLTTLTLDLQCCIKITDEAIKSLCSEGLRYLTSLTSLTLYFTSSPLTDEGVKSLCSKGLRYLTSLTILTLHFGYCEEITDEGLKSLCSEGLRYLTSLTSLTLDLRRCNKITDEGMKSLSSEGLRYLDSLTTLTLHFGYCEEITDEGLKSLCSEGLRYLTSLTILNINFESKRISHAGKKDLLMILNYFKYHF